MYQVPLVVYEQLREATPEGKRDIVLSLIEEHPNHRLELPEWDGLRADLSDVDLGREALQELVERWAGATPPWWDANLQGADLGYANLQGANLVFANLQGANLVFANLQGANLCYTKLQDANLESAELKGAILTNANLQGAILSSANLQGAFLSNADLQGAILSSANLQGAFLSNADLQGAKLRGADLQRAELWDAYLQGANLVSANLQGADLPRANLQGAILGAANLQGANLLGANLQGAILWDANLQGAILFDANLQGADLRHAKLQGLDLSTCTLTRCHFDGAFLDRTRLRREQLVGGVGGELDGAYTEARVAYLGLKGNFDSLGDYAASSWAYRKERRMEKREALQKARKAHTGHAWKRALSSYAKVLTDQTVELVCDYGEGFLRVLVCLALLWLGFALFYGIMGHVLADRGPVYSTTRNVIDLLSFSLATMVTLEVPGLQPFASLLMRILMPLEAALGIILLGLLGFVAGNRIRRS